MGPSAPNTTPIYYYNNNFDSGGVSEWSVYQNGGGGTMQAFLDATTYNSPTQSLCVSTSGAVGADSMVYQIIPINISTDTWVEFDLNFKSAVPAAFEFFMSLGTNKKNVNIGYDTVNLYLAQGNGLNTVASLPDVNMWHHFKIRVAATTGLATYWMDGINLGTDYSGSRTQLGSPPTGYIIGVSVGTSNGSLCHIDNLKCYHY
jgi:hypothetical protein